MYGELCTQGSYPVPAAQEELGLQEDDLFEEFL
jgi:hypothetical protein